MGDGFMLLTLIHYPLHDERKQNHNTSGLPVTRYNFVTKTLYLEYFILD